MTGYRNYNWAAFRDLAQYRRHKGFNVVTPIEIDEEGGYVKVVEAPDGRILEVSVTEAFDYEEVLARDLEAVETCQRIVLLDGWTRSAGAKRELEHALSLGHEVLLESEIRREY
jgi:hypothetical protein